MILVADIPAHRSDRHLHSIVEGVGKALCTPSTDAGPVTFGHPDANGQVDILLVPAQVGHGRTGINKALVHVARAA